MIWKIRMTPVSIARLVVTGLLVVFVVLFLVEALGPLPSGLLVAVMVALLAAMVVYLVLESRSNQDRSR